MKGDNRIMKMSIALMALSIPVAAYSATAHRDPRTREFVDPVRIVATSHGLEGADILSAPKFGQVPEGRFLAGSGVVLSNDEWLVLDFGRELHGSLQIGSGAKGGRGAKVRVRFGESVSESMSELKGAAEGATATNDHAIRDDVGTLPWLGRREIGETGFRSVRIDNAGTGPVQLEYVRAVSTMRPMARLGSFRCSDERLNRVFETAVRTVHLCCQDYIWDGIKRDRLVWMGDTHPETKSILAVFGAAEHVYGRQIRSITKTLNATSRINGRIKDLPHSELGKFYAILEGKHNLATFALVNLHAHKHLEQAIARTDGIVMHSPVAGLHLQLLNFIRKGINLRT